jgi:hypothetical protein
MTTRTAKIAISTMFSSIGTPVAGWLGVEVGFWVGSVVRWFWVGLGVATAVGCGVSEGMLAGIAGAPGAGEFKIGSTIT